MSELIYKGAELVIENPILLPIPFLIIACIIALIGDSVEYFINKERTKKK